MKSGYNKINDRTSFQDFLLCLLFSNRGRISDGSRILLERTTRPPDEKSTITVVFRLLQSCCMCNLLRAVGYSMGCSNKSHIRLTILFQKQLIEKLPTTL